MVQANCAIHLSLPLRQTQNNRDERKLKTVRRPPLMALERVNSLFWIELKNTYKGWLMTLPLGHYSQAKPTSHRPEHWKVSMGLGALKLLCDTID